MANSPAHKFGQEIGNLLERLVKPDLERFCSERGLYLDTQGKRAPARKGKKVSWIDKYGNSHDLDFVIELGGTKEQIGRPVAFIEAAWRRYTKHSRNKSQEIQGAILPIADKYEWDVPFLGTVLAGEFTNGSLSQLRSRGFEILYFPYQSIVAALAQVGINACFDEATSDDDFQAAVDSIADLSPSSWKKLEDSLRKRHRSQIKNFFDELAKCLDRKIKEVFIIPLHGDEAGFVDLDLALKFIEDYRENEGDGVFRKYEIIVKYSNGDQVDASFSDKKEAIKFLKYLFD